MVEYTALIALVEQVFKAMGCPPDQAKTGALALVSADLRGIDSHGVARLSGYVRLWEAKRVNASPNITIIHETPSTAVIDGDQGLGLVVAPAAMDLALAKLHKLGQAGSV